MSTYRTTLGFVVILLLLVSSSGIVSAQSTSKRTRGSSAHVGMPENLMLGDVDADGLADFIRRENQAVLVTKTDFERTPILRFEHDQPISGLLTGDFLGEGYDQTCLFVREIDTLQCYGTSPDRRALWWWFTQPLIFERDDDAVVADYNGDGRDDILVYSRAGKPYRMYTLRGNAIFEPMEAFGQGNLEGAMGKGMRVLAGNFNDDQRADLLIVNPHGQIAYFGSVFDGTYNTFWWAWTTHGGFVGGDDQVAVARIDDNATDDAVLHNHKTGAMRFYRMEWIDGLLPPIMNVSYGQITADPNSYMFWAPMHGPGPEPGGQYRDDLLVFNVDTRMFVRSDAVWDGTALTYWWAWTQHVNKDLPPPSQDPSPPSQDPSPPSQDPSPPSQDPLPPPRPRLVVCANTVVPPGYIVVNDAYDPTTCGSPAYLTYNVWYVESYAERPVGAAMQVCSGVSIPYGWAVTGTGYDPTRCGHPSTIAQNVTTITRVQ